MPLTLVFTVQNPHLDSFLVIPVIVSWDGTSDDFKQGLCVSTLGFQREADSLLSVTKLSTMSDSKNTRKAREMLLKLAEETSIFPASWELSERYLLVVVSGCLSSSPRLVTFSVISGTPTSQPHQLHQDRVANGDATVSTCGRWLQSHPESFEEKDFWIPPKAVET